MSISTKAFPRAALVGNPSDGYFGKTIAFTFSDFCVEVNLLPSSQLHIIPGKRDRLVFESISDLVDEVRTAGYYGGIRLVKATIKKLYDYCYSRNIEIPVKNFSITFSSTIPDRLGLAGSSAIVTACVNAMLLFYEIEIPAPELANLVLAVEKEELLIAAGLQDRVAQVFNRPVFMDFDKKLMQRQGYGNYVTFEKTLLPPLYIAYRQQLAEGSEVTHNDFAKRFQQNDAAVIQAVEKWKMLTDEVFRRLQNGNRNIGDLLNENFDLRKAVMPVNTGNIELVETARSVGASAKLTGSGGAIIGCFDDEKMFENLIQAMMKIGATVIKPKIIG